MATKGPNGEERDRHVSASISIAMGMIEEPENNRRIPMRSRMPKEGRGVRTYLSKFFRRTNEPYRLRSFSSSFLAKNHNVLLLSYMLECNTSLDT